MKAKTDGAGSLKVLLLEDVPRDVEIIREQLIDAGYDDLIMDCTAKEATFVSLLRSRPYDIILADFKLPGFDGFTALQRKNEIAPHLPFICVSGTIGEETAVELLKQGAVDYVMKDRLARLPMAIRQALDGVREKWDRRRAESEKAAAVEALRCSEEKFRNMVETAREGIWTVDSQSRTTFVNARLAEMLGYNPEELLGKPLAYFMFEEDLNDQEKQMESRRLGQSENYERRFRHRDGHTIWAIISATPQMDGNDCFRGSFSMATDITERRQADEKLRETERKLREAQELAHLGYWIWDIKTGNVEWSKEVFRIFCLDPKEFTPRIDAILALSPWPADHQRDQELIRRAMENHNTGSYEQRFLRPDQTTGYYLSTFQGKYDGNGELVSIMGTVLDITKLKKVEEQLQLLKTAIEEMNEGLLITDGRGTIRYVNQAFTKITGYSAAEALGQTPRILKSGSQVKRLYDDMWADLLSGKPWAGELVNKRKDGAYYPQRTAISPVHSSDGSSHYISIFQDVTKEKKLEEQLLQAVKMESLGRLAGGIAHDFNNLLTVINGYGELLVHRVTDEALHADLQEIVNAGEKAARLTAQILAFSRQQEFNLEPVNVNELLRKTASMLERVLGEETKLQLDLADDLPDIRCDRSQLEQVVMNLVVNARDAMPRGGTLTIRTFPFRTDDHSVSENNGIRPGDYLCLAVADTGSGIDPFVRDHIFEPFFTTKKAGEGTGLGLAMVYGIVKQHNGCIRVESEVGVGTTFFVSFPIGTPATASSGSGVIDKSTTCNWNGRRVLLVEDQEEVRRMARRILEQAGFEVEAFADPVDGLRSGQTNRYDLLVSDLAMKGMSGDILASRLRERTPGLAVLLISGSPERFTAICLNLDQPFRFLKKPFGKNEFLNTLAILLPPTVSPSDHG
jgi:two-component system, cell cycle sensor histidine kinase and response regulator CckA